jgi:hypothetical protein
MPNMKESMDIPRIGPPGTLVHVRLPITDELLAALRRGGELVVHDETDPEDTRSRDLRITQTDGSSLTNEQRGYIHGVVKMHSIAVRAAGGGGAERAELARAIDEARDRVDTAAMVRLLRALAAGLGER